MKAIIYAGIGLFSVATAYGIVDYYGSQKNGSINKLYIEKEPAASPGTNETTTNIIPVKNVDPVSEEPTVLTSKLKPAKKISLTKKIKMEDFSRARIPEQMIEEQTAPQPEKKELEIVPVSKKEMMEEKIVIVEDENKKINLDMYSRAPLKKRTKQTKTVVTKN